MHYPDKLIPSSKKGRDWTRKGVDLGSELTNRQIGEANEGIDRLTERLAMARRRPRDSSMSSAT